MEHVPRCPEEERERVTTGERPTTVGELRESGYEPVSVREEMRRNLIARIRAGETIFPGVYGYDDTVIRTS